MATPNLGYGKQSEANINSVNQWMRSQPWYQQLLQSWGVNPASVKLSSAQKQAVLRAAQANGIVVDEGKMEVDDAGNFNPKGHKLRNALIAGAIGAGAAFGIPALAGALGSGAGAGAGAAAAGSGVGIGETGATLGLAGSGFGMAPVGTAVLGTGAAAGAGAAAKGGTMAAIGSALKGGAGNLMRGVGGAIGDAATAAGNNRVDQEHAALTANQQNISGQSAFERELMDRALEERTQRKDAMRDMSRASFYSNQPHSPYNPVATPALSTDYRSALDGAAAKAKDVLAKSPMYAVGSMPALKPYQPLDINSLPHGSQSTLERIGNWVGPALTVGGRLIQGR